MIRKNILLCPPACLRPYKLGIRDLSFSCVAQVLINIINMLSPWFCGRNRAEEVVGAELQVAERLLVKCVHAS